MGPIVALTAVLAVVAAGCRRPGGSTPEASHPTTSVAAEAGTPAVAAAPDDDGPADAPSAAPIFAARTVAEAFARAWARPDLPAAAWLAGVAPYAVPGYAALLVSVDPANIPTHTLTGPATTISSTTVVMVFAVPTDAGALRVTCSLLGKRWLVSGVEPDRWPPP